MSNAAEAGQPGRLMGVPGGKVARDINNEIERKHFGRLSNHGDGPMVCVCEVPKRVAGTRECMNRECHRPVMDEVGEEEKAAWRKAGW